MHPLVYAPDDMIIIASYLCFIAPLIDTKTVKIKNKNQLYELL